MENRMRIATAVFAGLLLVGCDKKDDTTTTAPPIATPPAVTTADMPAATQPTMNSATDQMTHVAGPVTGAATNAQTAAADAAASTTDVAKTKLQQVGTYLADKKYDAADAVLKEVEGMKSSLPKSVQDEVTALRTQVNLAKSANGAGLSMPSLGGGK